MKDTYKSSDKAAEINYRGGKPKYPWRTMNVGTSFVISHGEVKATTLQSYSSLMGKRTGRKFRVIDHGSIDGYEVARVE